jgi:hypothetical protein
MYASDRLRKEFKGTLPKEEKYFMDHLDEYLDKLDK